MISTVKNSSVGRAMIPIEAITKWPIPFFYKDKVYIKLLFFITAKQEVGKIAIYPPCIEVTLDYQTGNIVGMNKVKHDPRYGDLEMKEVIGTFPHEAIRTLKKSDYLQMQDELIELISHLIQSSLEKQNMEESVSHRLSDLLNLLLEPCLIEYYRKANDKFIQSFIKV